MYGDNCRVEAAYNDAGYNGTLRIYNDILVLPQL